MKQTKKPASKKKAVQVAKDKSAMETMKQLQSRVQGLGKEAK